MRVHLTMFVLALAAVSGCTTEKLAYERMSTGEVVTRVLKTQRPFDLRSKEAIEVLRERFPVGSTYEAIGRELSDARQLHRYATDFGDASQQDRISFYVYRYDAGETGRFRKDGVLFIFLFDESKLLKEVTYAHSAFSF